MIGLSLRTAPDHVAFALGLREIGRDPQITTALDVTGRVLRTATDHVDSIRDPLLVGEVIVTAVMRAVSSLLSPRGETRDCPC